MRAYIKNQLLILIPEANAETQQLQRWVNTDNCGDATAFSPDNDARFTADHRHFGWTTPVRISADHPIPELRLIRNSSTTPFYLDGLRYSSLESFEHSLRATSAAQRIQIAALPALLARRLCQGIALQSPICYQGQIMQPGSTEYCQLLARACQAKFEQNLDARHALLSTGTLPLTVETPCESPVLPDTTMTRIWMTIRHRLTLEDAQPHSLRN